MLEFGLGFIVGGPRGIQQCHRVSGCGYDREEYTARAWGTKPLSLSCVLLVSPPWPISLHRVLFSRGSAPQQVCWKTAFRRGHHCCICDPVRCVVCVIWGLWLTSTMGIGPDLSASRRALWGVGNMVGVAVVCCSPRRDS